MNQFEMKLLAYQSHLKSRTIHVLLYLIDRANKELTCFPTVPTIGKELHISVSTVKHAMRELVKIRYVAKENRFREGNKKGTDIQSLYFAFLRGRKGVGAGGNHAEVYELNRTGTARAGRYRVHM